MPTELLSIRPGELKFPFELRKQISSTLQLVNTTDSYVAFKVKTTSPKKYCVRPNIGLVLPGATCEITVTMQSQREAPPDLQCKDKFLVQSVIVADGVQQQEVSQDLFSREPGKEVFETKLRVVYVEPPQASPVPNAEERVSSESFEKGDGSLNGPGQDTGDSNGKLAELRSQVTRLTEDKKIGIQPSQHLQDEKRPVSEHAAVKGDMALQHKATAGFSFLFVLAVGLLGVMVGYFLRSPPDCSSH